jgi:hypothetical protein
MFDDKCFILGTPVGPVQFFNDLTLRNTYLCLLPQSKHRVAMPLTGVHSILMEKSAQPGEGGGCTARPPPVTTVYSIYYHVQSCNERFS